jgi:hypothetical protein
LDPPLKIQPGDPKMPPDSEHAGHAAHAGSGRAQRDRKLGGDVRWPQGLGHCVGVPDNALGDKTVQVEKDRRHGDCAEQRCAHLRAGKGLFALLHAVILEACTIGAAAHLCSNVSTIAHHIKAARARLRLWRRR